MILSTLQFVPAPGVKRDPRFDGRFFIGVLTTRIYCRPICPARSPKEENVRYFASAAAAAEAGLRPCLRCRPECSPGTPAWLGTSATVSRALRLITESNLAPENGNGGMEALAARLGIGPRHLRRLFLQHLGASPVDRRPNAPPSLRQETSRRDPSAHACIGLASGFGSIRRFNATFLKTYGRSPTQLRQLGKKARHASQQPISFSTSLPYTFLLGSLFQFLAPRAIPGVELVEGAAYRRMLLLQLKPDRSKPRSCLTPSLSICRFNIRNPGSFSIVERARSLFDFSADPPNSPIFATTRCWAGESPPGPEFVFPAAGMVLSLRFAPSSVNRSPFVARPRWPGA